VRLVEPITNSPVPLRSASCVSPPYQRCCCKLLFFDTEYHKVLFSKPSAKSVSFASTKGYKTIFVPALLVVNVGAPLPFVLKSIRFPVVPLRYICPPPVAVLFALVICI